jgi:hypothetical protein
MAGIIPRAQQSVRTNPSSPVPVRSAESAGQVYADEAKMWDGLTKVGVAVGEYYDKQAKAEERIQEEEAVNRVRDGIKTAKDEADRESQADGGNYQEVFASKVSERMGDLVGQDDLSPETRKRVYSYGSMAYQDASTQIGIEAAVKKEKTNYARLEGLADQAANRVRENPKEELMGAELKSYGSMLDEIAANGGMSAENAGKAREAFYSKVAAQYIEGLEDRGSYGKALNALKANQADPNLFTAMDPEQAKQLGFIDSREASALAEKGEQYKVPVLTKGANVKLTPELSAVMSGMDPKHKADWIDRLRSKALAESAMKLSELNAQVNGFEQVAMSGAKYEDKAVAQIKEQINGNPHLSVTARKRMMDAVNTADTVNKQVQLLADTPRSKWGEVSAGFDDKINLSQNYAAKFDSKMADAGSDFAIQANRLQAKEKFNKYAKQIAAYQDQHAAEYVLQTDKNVQLLYQASKSGQPSDVQNYVSASLQKQSYLGIAPENRKVLPDVASSSDLLKNMPNGYEASNHLNKLQAMYGPYFPKAMAEMTAHDQSLGKYMTMVYAPPQVRAELGDAIKNEKAINEAFQKVPGYDALNSSIKNMSALKMEQVQKALLNGSSNSGRLNVVNSMTEAIQLQARRDAMTPGTDPAQAVEKAYKRTIDSQFMFASGGQSAALVPRQIGPMRMEEGIVDAFLRAHSTKDGVKELNLGVPGTYKDADHYAEAVSREGRWVTNEAFDGLSLKLRDPDNGQFMPVLDKFGKPVEVKYQDINLRPTERTKTQDSYKGRLFNSIGEGMQWLDKNVALPNG